MTSKKYLLYASQNYAFAILRPLQHEIQARGDEVFWFLKGDSINVKYLRYDELQLESIEAVIAYEPDVVFVPGNLVPHFIPGLKVAIFHGFNSGKLNRKGKEDHFNIRGCFDLYCTQGPNTTKKFTALANKHKHFIVNETGWPAIDPLFETVNEKQGTIPTVLMCSTFSRNLTCAPILFNKIKALSATGKWNWLVQFHPKMDSNVVELYKSIESEYLTFVETDNVLPLLQSADVMVCDTSSVIDMFLLLEKPVVTFKNSSPKEHNIDIDDVELLESSIEEALSRPASLMKNIAEFVYQTHPYKDGKSAQRVLNAVDKMLTGENRPSKAKPFNLIRRLKMRKSLKYWKF